MEQTWYLFPGQTLENTKIKDRGKALIATPAAWRNITDHLDRKQVQQEILDQEMAHRKFLKDGSKNMTKDWDNSIEKMRQRRMDEHELKVKAREENLYKRFMELRKEQAEERNRIVDEAKKRMFMIKDDPRSINSALVLTEVLHERRMQQDFDAVERERQRHEDDKYAALVTFNAEQEKIENKEKQRLRREIDLKYSKELKEQYEQHEAATRKAKEDKIKAETEDNIKAAEELKAIKEYELLLDRKKKAHVKQLFHDFSKEKAEIREEQRKQEESEDQIIKIVAKATCRIEDMKKAKDKLAQAEKIKIREKIAAKVMAEQASNEEEEERIFVKNQKEYEEKELERLEKDAKYQAKLKREREQYRLQVLERQRKEAAEKRELDKWDMVNRLKATEVVNKHDHNRDQRIFDEKIQYREMLDKQIKDDDKSEYDKKCKEQEELYFKQKLENEHKSFFAYADEVMDLAKYRGRTTVYLEKVVAKYKKENNLEPRKKNLTALQSKVPINNKNK